MAKQIKARWKCGSCGVVFSKAWDVKEVEKIPLKFIHLCSSCETLQIAKFPLELYAPCLHIDLEDDDRPGTQGHV